MNDLNVLARVILWIAWMCWEIYDVHPWHMLWYSLCLLGSIAWYTPRKPRKPMSDVLPFAQSNPRSQHHG